MPCWHGCIRVGPCVFIYLALGPNEALGPRRHSLCSWKCYVNCAVLSYLYWMQILSILICDVLMESFLCSRSNNIYCSLPLFLFLRREKAQKSKGEIYASTSLLALIVIFSCLLIKSHFHLKCDRFK